MNLLFSILLFFTLLQNDKLNIFMFCVFLFFSLFFVLVYPHWQYYFEYFLTKLNFYSSVPQLIQYNFYYWSTHLYYGTGAWCPIRFITPLTVKSFFPTIFQNCTFPCRDLNQQNQIFNTWKCFYSWNHDFYFVHRKPDRMIWLSINSTNCLTVISLQKQCFYF